MWSFGSSCSESKEIIMATKTVALNRSLYGSKASALKRERKDQKRDIAMNQELLGMAKGGAVKKSVKSPAPKGKK